VPTGREIRGCDLAHHTAQPGSDIPFSGLCRLPHLLVSFRLDDEEEMSHKALGIVTVDMA
jgi:hypothetical protein